MPERDLANSFRDVCKTFGAWGPLAEPRRKTFYPPASNPADKYGRPFTTTPDYHVRSHIFTEKQLSYVERSMSLLGGLVQGKAITSEGETEYPSLSRRIEDTFHHEVQSRGDIRFGSAVINSLFDALTTFQEIYPDMVPALYTAFKEGGYHTLSKAAGGFDKAEFPLYLGLALSGQLTKDAISGFRSKYPRAVFVGLHGKTGYVHDPIKVSENWCPAHFFVAYITHQELLAAINLATSPDVRERYRAVAEEEFEALTNFPQKLEVHMKKLMAKTFRSFLVGDKDWGLKGSIYYDVFNFLKESEES